MEKILNQILGEIKELKQGQGELRLGQDELRADVNSLKSDVGSLKDDVSSLKVDVHELKRDINAIGINQQTDELTKFKTEVNNKIDSLIETQTSLCEMYGRHEAEIRNLRRRPV